MEGSGRMLVVAVGTSSQAGIIYSLLNNMKDGADASPVKTFYDNENGEVIILGRCIVSRFDVTAFVSYQSSSKLTCGLLKNNIVKAQ